MIQVKMIRNQANLIERDINEFLANLGSTPGYKIELIDIKLYHIASKDVDTALVIYNRYVPQSKQKAEPPKNRIPQPDLNAGNKSWMR